MLSLGLINCVQLPLTANTGPQVELINKFDAPMVELILHRANNDSTLTGCSSSQAPYMLPKAAGVQSISLLTTGDVIGGYTMIGAPDGLGAFDNGNGTYTVLMNHEYQGSTGAIRAHGSTGSFVSKWVIDKVSNCVLTGADLVQTVYTWNGTSFVAGTTAFSRFCSGDLPAPSAFYQSSTGYGTQERIFMSGEEGGTEGRVIGHIATGPNAGTSYQLPRLGHGNWENGVACPASGAKTVVCMTDDAGPGQVYIYIGTKQNTGSVIDMAGLHNGNLFGVKVSGMATELNASPPAPGTVFSLFDLGDVKNLTGVQLNANSNAASVTNFQRPEDSAWDPSHPNDLYFNTTNGFSSPSRLWRLRFTNILQPELGGTITAVLDGSEGQKMLDNITINAKGQIMVQEDVGVNAHLCKIFQYDIATDALTLIGQHDPASFLSGGASFLTQDEESSGILDVSDILGEGYYLHTVMAHYGNGTVLVEGGQLLLLRTDAGGVALNARMVLEGPYDPATGQMSDALRSSGLVPTNEPYTALGHVLQNAGATTTTSALSITGSNAIVEWVVVELRTTANPSAVHSAKAALLQRDGDIVEKDGIGSLRIPAPVGSYYVSVRHRNHLGVMTASPVPLSSTPIEVDFRSAGTIIYGSEARKSLTGTFPAEALWAGDVNANSEMKYTGPGNDRDLILSKIGGVVPTNTVTGYFPEDVNLSGVVQYTGPGNDRDIILENIGGVVPTNTRIEQLP